LKLRQNGIVSLMIRPAVFLAGGRAYMKLRQNGIVSFPIRLAIFSGQMRRSYETSYEIPPGRNSEQIVR